MNIKNEPIVGGARKDLIDGLYPLSGLQQGMLFHGLYDSKAGAYIEQFRCDLISPNLDIFIKSWDYVLAAHTILRSAFYYDKFSIPVQCVFKEVRLPIEVIDFRDMEAGEKSSAINVFVALQVEKGFDFKEAPLMRIALIRVDEERYHMIWIYHHIILDGWSMPILMEEFLQVYESFSGNEKLEVKEADRYEDYIRFIERRDKKQERLFWKNYLTDVDEGTLLPFIGKTTERTKGIGNYASIGLGIDSKRTAKIKNYTQKNRLTVNTLMQGVWSYLLHAYTAQSNVVYGVIVSGRPDDLVNVERRVGMYINTLPLCSSIDKKEKIEDWLARLQLEQVSLRQYQYTPLSDVKEWIGVQGDLFDSLLVFENYPVSKVIGERVWELKVENISIKEQTNYPLTLIIGAGEHVNIRFSYNTDLIEKAYIENICNHFENVLEQLIDSDGIVLGDVKILNYEKEQEILRENFELEIGYPHEKNVITLFEEQAQRTPGNIAVVFKEGRITYKELSERSNQLARYLRNKGVKEETLIPICIERGIEMIVGILGILKAGGAYVPVDPEYPLERISFLLEDTSSTIVLSSKGSRQKLPEIPGVEILEIDGDDEVAIEQQSTDKVQNFIRPGNLAYIIYTSGSTGKPKGVLIEHRNVVRLFETDNPLYDFNENDIWTMFHSFCFDFSVWEMYGALFYGGRVVIVSKEDTKDMVMFAELLEKEKVTVLNQTPSSFYVLQDIVTGDRKELSVRYVIFGGEALNPGKLRPWKQLYNDCSLINMYGITETTVHVTYQEIGWKEIEQSTSVIGKPIPTLSIYVLDDNQNLQPVGVAGELCIGGAGVARGYLNRPDLTASRFVKNPFSASDVNSRMYKSGDSGRRLLDGNIEYLGRMDDQVKIRGYRIELGEIESVIHASGMVKHAIILASSNNEGNRRLIGYIVPEAGFKKDNLVGYLEDMLPDYMIPGLWIEIEKLPLTSNGKIDKKSLPEPGADELVSNEYIAPRNELEQKLVDIWKNLLHYDRIGVLDNFFELGGHSLLAMRLLSAIRRQLGMQIVIKYLFTYPTIGQLSEFLQAYTIETIIPTIKVEKRPEQIPLSFSQERLWFIDQLEGSIQYNIPTVLKLKGDLNIDALKFALHEIINRHEVLRTVFNEKDGKVSQRVKSVDGFELQVIDNLKFKENPEVLNNWIGQLVSQPFDLSSDYMLKAYLVKLEGHQNVLVTVMHHIASDAWSVSILVKEVSELYESYIGNREAKLDALSAQYSDYSIWQRKYLQGAVLQEKIEYWEKKLKDVSTLQLPADYDRGNNKSIKGASYRFPIDKDLCDQLYALSHKEGTTLFMTLMAVYKILLYRYSGQEDTSVGTSIANRPHQEVENLVGFFVNTLALRDVVSGDMSFKELLQQVRTTTMEAYEHQDVPFEKVVEVTVTDRNQNRSPLFQVMLVLNNTPDIPVFKLGDIELSKGKSATNISKFEISFFLSETSNGIRALVEYSTDLYKEATIERMTAHFTELLRSVVSNPGEQVGKLNMLGIEEKQTIEKAYNKKTVRYPKEKSIVTLFEEQAAKTPQAVALVFGEEKLTYKELNERANQLAHHLRSKGIKEETLVPLFIERSAAMITGMLGIMKAGGAYVPVDTEFPASRISYMLKDSGAKLVVSSKESRIKLEDIEGIEKIAVIAIDAENKESKENLDTKVAAEQLAYVIYTSGSTGQPKGAMITHRNLTDYVYGLKAATQIDDCKSFALVSTIATDLGNTVLYSSLLTGGALHIFTKEATSDVYGLHKYFKEQQVDCLKIVPSHWKALSKEEELLLPNKLLVFGGEALHKEVAEQIEQTGTSCKIVNHYGPTETTIGKLLHVVEAGRKYGNTIPIGKPFSNTRVYVLSKEMELCPAGVPGQLYIAGDGVSRGYVNNEALTSQKFIKDPFSKEENAKMYVSGDLVKYLEDGNIEFIGRADDQVKIRGYRVELGEIESILQQSEAVKQAVVLAREDSQGNKRLIGYIVPAEDFDKEEIERYLENKLPEYMIPQVWVELESLPLTANGKVDRKALPEPEAQAHTKQYEAPRNETEEKLVEIWQDILEVEQVGIHDDFFELGGHSLLAIRLISMIRKELESEVKIGDVFDYPTIALLSGRIATEEPQALLPAIEVKARPQKIPLSFSQERLWFIDQLEGSVQYHIPVVLRLKGKLDKGALSYALQQIVNRHEVLRTVYREEEGKSWQYIKEKDGNELQITDGTKYKNDKEGLSKYIQQLIKTPFDLSEDNMLRVTLIELGEEDGEENSVLVATMHHIVSDAWSTSILVKEVVELYNAYTEQRAANLAQMQLQYADYSIWQRDYLKGELLDKKIAYWKEKLDSVATLQLPTDYKRPAVQSTRGSSARFKIDKELSDQLDKLSKAEGTTLFITLHAIYKVLLYRYSGQSDISIGTSIARREQQQLEGLIGFFVNTLALRDEVSGEQTFKELLQQVRTTTMEAYDHQEVPFEKVVEVVIKDRDKSRSPLFQVMLVLQNTPEVPELKLGEVRLSGEQYEHTTIKFELTFFIRETENGRQGSIQYCTDLYTKETIERMTTHFAELIKSAVNNPEEQVGKLQMLGEEERQTLIRTYNKTAVSYPKEKSIVTLFEEQVASTPQAIALVFGEEKLTYKELNERANQVAHYLRSKGIKEETLVPLFIERSAAMITGMLGIMKAGGAYVPVDTEFPASRISYMLEDSGAKLVVSSKESRRKLEDIEGIEEIEIIAIDEAASIGKESKENLETKVAAEQLAYVIYTSGSTGQPKGAMITHRNLADYVYGLKEATQIDECKSFALVSTIATDLGNTVLYSSLLTGGALHVFTKEAVSDIYGLHQYFSEHQIDCLKIVPSHWKALSKEEALLLPKKLLVFGGEALHKEVAEQIEQTGTSCKIVNHYGPTETTIGKLLHVVEKGRKYGNTIPIGKPFSNTRVYVLSKEMELCPTGVPGQLYIAGDGVARGYVNNEALTNQKFIKDPFSAEEGKMYVTGDLVKYLEDGNIEFIGRADDQVKIRGYRVELGEIESILQQSEAVKQAVVLAREDSQGNKRLIGYIVPEEDFDKEEIERYLENKLPEYMIPQAWVELESLPLTANGKIDRKALSEPEAQIKAGGYEAPRTETEQKLVEIWQEILEVEQVGIHDDFFELGGHSLLAVRMIYYIERNLSISIPINIIFEFTTISALSKYLDLQLEIVPQENKIKSFKMIKI